MIAGQGIFDQVVVFSHTFMQPGQLNVNYNRPVFQMQVHVSSDE
jgi:hypothetical protein